MLKLFTWNVNGVRAAQRKGFLDWLHSEQPDILGLCETKAAPEQLDDALRQPEGYHAYWASAERKGYSGTALLSRRQPRRVEIGLGIEEYDVEGRTIVADFDDFVLINAYFPNGGPKPQHPRLDYKMRYYADFLRYCEALRADGRSVVFCGDVNTSHCPIDLARPKANEKNTGFLPVERAWIDEVIAAGYVDIFRARNPELEGAYSWWSMRSGARERNVGWRLDYFFISPDLLDHVVDAAIRPDVHGSDHCPVSLTLDFGD
ncbi:MAG: exodeoxyribonuclease III [Anaerolineaceae bacterium]|nr:exodeoxyribonuclease III [Anaerolineaceae bacterium]MDE0327664.1 exodeoxyribonuclease III [Anaerolineaceae bacterium]